MPTLTATQARADLFNLIDQTNADHRPITITGKRSNAVLVSEDDWSAMQETVYLLGIPGMRESVLAARAESLDKRASKLTW